MTQDRVVRSVRIGDPQGLHIRQAAECARAAARYRCQIVLTHGDRRAENCRSPFDILQLGAAYGAEVVIEAVGPDAGQAVEELAAILTRADPE